MHDLPPGPNQRLANATADEPSAALLEALWRAEELAAALDRAQREIAALRGSLDDAERTIVEFTELGDAAQSAIDKLRKTLSEQTEQTNRAAAEREAVAVEFFAHRIQAAAEMRVLGEAVYRATANVKSDAPPSFRSRIVKYCPQWLSRILRLPASGASHRANLS